MSPYMTYVPAENKRNILGGEGTICGGAKPQEYRLRLQGRSYPYARAYLKKWRVRTKINNKLSYESE